MKEAPFPFPGGRALVWSAGNGIEYHYPLIFEKAGCAPDPLLDKLLLYK